VDIGEFVEDKEGVENVMGEVSKVIGDLIIGASEQRALDDGSGGEEDIEKGKEDEEKDGGQGGRPKVLVDGTYATEIAYTSMVNAKMDAVKAAAEPHLRTEFSFDVFLPQC
jgi:coatomer subunit beta